MYILGCFVPLCIHDGDIILQYKSPNIRGPIVRDNKHQPLTPGIAIKHSDFQSKWHFGVEIKIKSLRVKSLIFLNTFGWKFI